MINSIGASNIYSLKMMNSVKNSFTKLSDSTKSKLMALGVDTTNIKTELEGQTALKAIESTKESNQANNLNSNDSLKQDPNHLASKPKLVNPMMGMDVLSMMNKIYLNLT